MQIRVLHQPEGNVVGHELQLGKTEGEFVLGSDGNVVFRSPLHGHSVFVAPSVESFQRGASCWNSYCERVAAAGSEKAQLAEVDRLRADLEGLALLDKARNSIWLGLLEQAEHGQL